MEKVASVESASPTPDQKLSPAELESAIAVTSKIMGYPISSFFSNVIFGNDSLFRQGIL